MALGFVIEKVGKITCIQYSTNGFTVMLNDVVIWEFNALW